MSLRKDSFDNPKEKLLEKKIKNESIKMACAMLWLLPLPL